MKEATIKNNDLVLICHKERRYLKKVEEGKTFSGKGGILSFTDLIGNPFGKIYGEYEVYNPTIEDLIMYGVKRDTQIIYPKDAAFICMKLNVGNGSHVLESGTGSGALTIMLSAFVGAEGKIITVEKEERHFRNAKKNIERFSMFDNVKLINSDILDFHESDFDSIFIDVREPWHFLGHLWNLLKPSGSIGMIVPTANQISEILRAFDTHHGFGDLEVIEILLRKYKTVSERVRPFDRMVAHTGYLIFARKVLNIVTSEE